MTDNQQVAVIQNKKLIAKFANKYDFEPALILETLAATAFRPKGNNGKFPTVEQMMSLLVVANEYNLNPFTKEIYAFPQDGGIVPIVSIDGWMRIINGHKQFDGMGFKDNFDESGNLASVTCKIYRKDRSHAMEITEYFSECEKGTIPWKKWPARMLRHKAAIQCARYAFSFSGIVDPDEAERIQESIDVTPNAKTETAEEPAQGAAAFPEYPADKFATAFPIWETAIKAGKKSTADVISTVSTKFTLTAKQQDKIKAAGDGDVIPSSTTVTTNPIDITRRVQEQSNEEWLRDLGPVIEAEPDTCNLCDAIVNNQGLCHVDGCPNSNPGAN